MGSMVVAAALALAQRDGWSGEKLLRGIVGGYEMGALLGTSIRASGTFNPHFRASGLIGAFAAAGAAVTATSTDEDTAIHALSLAVNMACGINEWAWSGTPEIFIHNGIASRAGITSYDLARSGIEASATVLEGKDGFFRALGAGDGAVDVFRGWDQASQIGRGILDARFKPAAVCNFTQTSSALALKIAQEHEHEYEVHEIQSIRITTTSAAMKYPGCDNVGPLAAASSGKLSIQYGVCSSLAFARLDEETLARIHDPVVTSLMKKCALSTTPEYEKSYAMGNQPAKVEVVLQNGVVFQEAAPDVPWLNAQQVQARFLQEISPLAPGDKGKKMLERCLTLQGPDIGNQIFGV
jgi:2-methylcitrate dehydratase PrpD